MAGRRARTALLLLGCFALLSPLVPGAAGASGSLGSVVSAGVAGPGTTSLGGRCIGGGRGGLGVTQLATRGSYRVEGSVRKQDNGSRWEGTLGWFDDTVSGEGVSRQFRARADGGSWSRAAGFAGVDRGAFFDLDAASRRDHLCLMLLRQGRLAFGATFCREQTLNFIGVWRRPRTDQIVVRFWLLGIRADARWQLRYRATDGTQAQTVAVTDRANRRDGFLTSRAVLQGFADPRFHVSAVGPNGQHCGVSLDPRTVTARTIGKQQLRETMRDFRARTADSRGQRRARP